MRILTYKRTHTGDPDANGVFGVNDCMGRVRSLEFDAVIGIGGIGAEPRGFEIDGKITWVGVYPTRSFGEWIAPKVTFQRFILFDANGPKLNSLAPSLAKRMYQGKARYLLGGYSDSEQAEAVKVVQWAMEATDGIIGNQEKVHRGVRIKCVCKQARAKTRE
jgi:hypothetical protein